MNKLIAIILAAITLSCTGNSKRQQASDNNAIPDTAVATSAGNTLVAYFSATGTTKKVAEQIAQATGASLYEITPDRPYTSADLDWNVETSRSSIEMHDDNCRPDLGGEKIDLGKYDVIFLGFPNWWNLPPRQINTFIETHDLSGKKIIPFMTSGGSTIDNSEKYLKELYPRLNWHPGKLLNSTDSLTIWATQAIK